MKKILLLTIAIITLINCTPIYKKMNIDKDFYNGLQDGVYAKMETSKGELIIQFFDQEAPVTVANFVGLAQGTIENKAKAKGVPYYDGIVFHRVIKNFMIQCGDPDSKTARPNQQLGGGGVGYTIPAEFNNALFHKRGAVAAARMGDAQNPQKASSGCQFYIVDGRTFSTQDMQMLSQRTGHIWSPEQIAAYQAIGGAPHLDGGYTVFGEVVTGMEFVDMIASQPTIPGDRPKQDIKIISATIIK